MIPLIIAGVALAVGGVAKVIKKKNAQEASNINTQSQIFNAAVNKLAEINAAKAAQASEEEAQKNKMIILISIIGFVVISILAYLYFKNRK